MTTPAFQPVRFDTQFLRILVSDDAPLEIWDGELVSGDFLAPQSALERWKRGEMAIAPPMIILLGQWGSGGDSRARPDHRSRVRDVASSTASTFRRGFFSRP